MARLAMLVDTTLCTGCRGCQVACKQWWDLPAEPTRNRGSYENPANLSPSTLTRVTFHEVPGANGVQWFQLAWGCLHCGEAPCADVCPTRAVVRHPLGLVTLDRERCNGCGYCVTACPFDVPRLERNAVTGRGKMSKCTLCQDRVTNGLMPACAKTCPTAAIRFGDRGRMLVIAENRLAKLRASGFADATVYGADVMGGLGRLLVLGARPEAYGLPPHPAYPTLVRVWQRVAQPLGQIAVVATVLGLLVNFVATRRLRHAKNEEV